MRRKLTLIASAALILIWALARPHNPSRNISLQRDQNSVPQKIAEPPSGVAARIWEPRPYRIDVESGRRRDTEYWPQQPHPVDLRYRSLLPTRANDDPNDDPTQLHVWIVQFGGPLSQNDIDQLQRYEIRIFFPTVANAFHARASRASLARAAEKFVPKMTGW